MTWTPLLLVFLCYCTGSLSLPVLTQLPSFFASLGTSARLTCTLSSGFSVGNFWISWYQQKPGNPPRCLITFHLDSDKHQGSGVPSRFSTTNDASANAGILHISGLQPENEATTVEHIMVELRLTQCSKFMGKLLCSGHSRSLVGSGSLHLLQHQVGSQSCKAKSQRHSSVVD
ncbi:Immunoglobulin iota chain [Tupaia chinensis]|nr:Immunoglobulin iota chain [Tupaia chinensis]